MEPYASLLPKRSFLDSQGYINFPKSKRTPVNYFVHPHDFTAEQISGISKQAIKRLVIPQNFPRINRAIRVWMAKAKLVINHPYKAKIEKVCIAIIQRKIALSQGKEVEIMNDLKFILDSKPNYLPALLASASMELRFEKNQEAFLIAGRCLELDPENPEALSIRALARIRNRDIVNSFEDLFKALQSPLNHELRKRIYPVLNECIFRVQASTKSLLFDPKSELLKYKNIIIKALDWQLMKYCSSKNYQKALEIVDYRLYIDDSTETSVYRAAILIQLEQYRLAENELNTKRSGECSANYWALKGLVKHHFEHIYGINRNGDITADRCYNQALLLDSKNVIALHGIAAGYVKRRDYQFAMVYFAKVLEVIPDDAEAREGYAYARSALSFREAYEASMKSAPGECKEKARKEVTMTCDAPGVPRRILKPRSVISNAETPAVNEPPNPPGIITRFFRALFKQG